MTTNTPCQPTWPSSPGSAPVTGMGRTAPGGKLARSCCTRSLPPTMVAGKAHSSRPVGQGAAACDRLGGARARGTWTSSACTRPLWCAGPASTYPAANTHLARSRWWPRQSGPPTRACGTSGLPAGRAARRAPHAPSRGWSRTVRQLPPCRLRGCTPGRGGRSVGCRSSKYLGVGVRECSRREPNSAVACSVQAMRLYIWAGGKGAGVCRGTCVRAGLQMTVADGCSACTRRWCTRLRHLKTLVAAGSECTAEGTKALSTLLGAQCQAAAPPCPQRPRRSSTHAINGSPTSRPPPLRVKTQELSALPLGGASLSSSARVCCCLCEDAPCPPRDNHTTRPRPHAPSGPGVPQPKYPTIQCNTHQQAPAPEREDKGVERQVHCKGQVDPVLPEAPHAARQLQQAGDLAAPRRDGVVGGTAEVGPVYDAG